VPHGPLLTKLRAPVRTCALILIATALALGACALQAFAQTKKAAPATPQFGHWGPSGYHLIRKIPIPGNDSAGRLAFNTVRRRVFFAYGTHVLVINPYLGKIVGDIRGLQGARDVVFANELQRGFVTEQSKNDVVIFDPLTQKIIGRAPTAAGPDSITYDPATKRVFTMNPRSSTATAISAVDGKPLGDISLGGQPSSAVSDGKGNIYLNLTNTSEELRVDAKALRILNRWPLAPCENPSGLSIDPDRRVLFVGCSNDKMGIMNADTGKILAAPATGSGTGEGRFDPVTMYALSANSDGTLTIVIEAGDDRFNVVENVETERGASSMALDPKIHEVYVVTSDFAPAPPNSPPHTPPKMIPGTTHLLVFARDYQYK
jgi:DNA-binding beta-propeller fold protein YncE